MKRNEQSRNQIAKRIAFVRHCPGVYVGEKSQCLRFLQAALWITRTSAQWRELPEPFDIRI